jgi:Uma2 family endonuclease
MVMSGKPDWSWLREAMSAPIVSMDTYLEMPEDLSRTIEVVDGMIVHCESPSENHQGIQQALVNALGEAARKLDRRFGTCHRVRGDLDVLLTEVPFHFKRPDVVLYRCLPEDRSGRWSGKPVASDVLIVLEIVSQHSISADTAEKRIEYAAAGIPHYWIVRMAQEDGPAVSVERLRLTSDRHYVLEQITFRGQDHLAVQAIDPLELALSWEQLDEWL